MDFDHAVHKLNREQSALRNAARHKQQQKQKQNLQAARMRKLAQERQAKLEKARILKEKTHRIITDSERELQLVKSSSATNNAEDQSECCLKLKPVSVWGDGDKITLPTSVLESLLAKYQNDLSGVTPMTFRVGVLNLDYQFPACDALKSILSGSTCSAADVLIEEEDDAEVRASEERRKMYLQELSHKYHSYTYATVVEFTQEEGHVGVPIAIARSLCGNRVPTRRTIDPAVAAAVNGSSSRSSMKMDVDDNNEHTNAEHDNNDSLAARAMDVDNAVVANDNCEPKTPGHIAYGAFDVPDMDVELSMVVLPKGKGCTLVPSVDALRRGFHGLKDVKATLEQSLIRTRATLSLGDEVYVWHRGVQFDLRVSQVVPSDFGAVSCINTDIEVDFGSPLTEEASPAPVSTVPSSLDSNVQSPLSNGRPLSEKVTSSTNTDMVDEPNDDVGIADGNSISVEEIRSLLPNEPPLNQTDGVCTILIRSSDGKSDKRRFDISNATIRDLFNFALTIANKDASFQLVTRFPRKVFSCPVGDEVGSSLVDAGITAGQEMFLIEWI